MNMRILLSGLAGGIVMFIWGSLSHMALGLGEIGTGGNRETAGLKFQSLEVQNIFKMTKPVSEIEYRFFPLCSLGFKPACNTH